MQVIVLSPYADLPIGSNGLSIGRADFLPYDPKTGRGFTTRDPDLDGNPGNVSRTHLCLFPRPAGLLVQDDSEHGTFVYGQRTVMTTIPWDGLADTRVELAYPCFCMRFLEYRGWKVRKGNKRLNIPFPKNTIFKIVLGRHKHPLEEPPLLRVLLHCEAGSPTSSAEVVNPEVAPGRDAPPSPSPKQA